MDIERLIHMANQIGAFFQAEPDRAVALEGIAGHLRRFWDPRMRKQILAWVDERGAEGLTEIVAEAIRLNRDKLLAS
jgi:formate dehydrogenase subunit delta